MLATSICNSTIYNKNLFIETPAIATCLHVHNGTLIIALTLISVDLSQVSQQLLKPLSCCFFYGQVIATVVGFRIAITAVATNVCKKRNYRHYCQCHHQLNSTFVAFKARTTHITVMAARGKFEI